MRKKVALYFGSFNPIHLGHKYLCQYLTNGHKVDEVWFVISPCNPLKKQSDLLDQDIRLKMVEMTIKDNSKFKVCDIEFNMSIPSYTIDTLNKISDENPDIDFSLIIGSDNALLFDKWKNSTEILEKYPIWVYPRFGYDFNEVSEKYPQMKLLLTPYYDISSTMIRNDLKHNTEWINIDVLNFIKNNKLYNN